MRYGFFILIRRHEHALLFPICRRPYGLGLFIIILITLCSCAGTKPPGPSPYHGLSNEEQIYSLVFDMALRSDSLYRAAVVFEFSQSHMQRALDSVRQLPDSIVLRVSVCDTTFYADPVTKNFLRTPVHIIMGGAPRITGRKPDDRTDAEFIQMLKDACTFHSSSSRFEIKKIHSRYRFHCTRENSIHRFSESIPTPRISFSKIFFNADSTKAIVYREVFPIHWDATGRHVFLEKEQGDWRFYAYFGGWMASN
jgi:hypothetical protein